MPPPLLSGLSDPDAVEPPSAWDSLFEFLNNNCYSHSWTHLRRLFRLGRQAAQPSSRSRVLPLVLLAFSLDWLLARSLWAILGAMLAGLTTSPETATRTGLAVAAETFVRPRVALERCWAEGPGLSGISLPSLDGDLSNLFGLKLNGRYLSLLVTGLVKPVLWRVTFVAKWVGIAWRFISEDFDFVGLELLWPLISPLALLLRLPLSLLLAVFRDVLGVLLLAPLGLAHRVATPWWLRRVWCGGVLRLLGRAIGIGSEPPAGPVPQAPSGPGEALRASSTASRAAPSEYSAGRVAKSLFGSGVFDAVSPMFSNRPDGGLSHGLAFSNLPESDSAKRSEVPKSPKRGENPPQSRDDDRAFLTRVGAFSFRTSELFAQASQFSDGPAAGLGLGPRAPLPQSRSASQLGDGSAPVPAPHLRFPLCLLFVAAIAILPTQIVVSGAVSAVYFTLLTIDFLLELWYGFLIRRMLYGRLGGRETGATKTPSKESSGGRDTAAGDAGLWKCSCELDVVPTGLKVTEKWEFDTARFFGKMWRRRVASS